MLAVEVGEALTRVQRQDALTTAAATDPLTGLPNRRWWNTLIEHELAEAARTGISMAVAIIDLDYFKDWNDEHGHQAGDELLYQAALAWKRELRGGDVLARIGGDEFVIALPGCDVPTAGEIASRMSRAIPHGRTASTGIAFGMVWRTRRPSSPAPIALSTPPRRTVATARRWPPDVRG